MSDLDFALELRDDNKIYVIITENDDEQVHYLEVLPSFVTEDKIEEYLAQRGADVLEALRKVAAEVIAAKEAEEQQE